MGRFLNFLILVSIVLSAFVAFFVGAGATLIIFKYVNLYAGFVTLLVLETVRVIIIDPFKPKFYHREFRFFSYGLKFDDSSRYFLRTTYQLRTLPLLRPEAIFFYFTLLILYIPQVYNSINQTHGKSSIFFLTLFLMVLYCFYTWSVLAIDLMKQNQLTLLENTILSFMKEYDFYDKELPITDNLDKFTSYIIKRYSVEQPSKQKPTNENVYKLDQYQQTLAIVKEELPEDLKEWY